MERIGFQPSFGSVVYEMPKREVEVYIANNFGSIDRSIEGDKLLKTLEEHPVEVTITYGYKRSGDTKLSVFVGEKNFTENFFRGPITVLKKALKAANKLL